MNRRRCGDQSHRNTERSVDTIVFNNVLNCLCTWVAEVPAEAALILSPAAGSAVFGVLQPGCSGGDRDRLVVNASGGGRDLCGQEVDFCPKASNSGHKSFHSHASGVVTFMAVP